MPGTRSRSARRHAERTGARCSSSRPGRPTTSQRSCAGAAAGCARARKSVTRTSGRATCRRKYATRRRCARRGAFGTSAPLRHARRHSRRPAHAHHVQRRARRAATTWSRNAARSDTSTSRSPITPSTPRRSARSIAMASSGSATRSRSCASSFRQLTILHGIEADILRDGRIDCADDVMESLDIVLASLHERDGDDGRRLTKRCLTAIQHPLVSIITHPQNQLVGHRAPYDMDYDAIYEAAAATGTALEIDGAPAHLDLDGPHARDAVAARRHPHDRQRLSSGAMAGSADGFRRSARPGAAGSRPRHVLNTRPLADVRAFIAASEPALTDWTHLEEPDRRSAATAAHRRAGTLRQRVIDRRPDGSCGARVDPAACSGPNGRPAGRGDRPAPAGPLRHRPRFHGRFLAHVRGRRPQEDHHRTGHAPGQEARAHAVGICRARAQAVRLGRPEDLLVSSQPTSR